MRESPLKDQLTAAGASFRERYGVEVAATFAGYEQEYRQIRELVGITDFSHMQKFRVPEATGLDFVDSLVAGNVAKVRFGRMLHTFLADSEGLLEADCYVANNDEEFIVLCESIIDDQLVRARFLAEPSSGVEDLTDSHTVIGIDGFQAWRVVKKLFGADVLGLPYLSIELYPFEGETVRLLRSGKTSEFGYLVMVPRQTGDALLRALLDAAAECNGCLCGVDVHDSLRLEGRFFNIFAEGARVRDPLALGLQWMIDFDKPEFCGRSPILERRTSGLTKKIVGVSAGPGSRSLDVGSAVYHSDQRIGQVEASCFSFMLDSAIGLALIDIEFAYAGLSFCTGSPGGVPIRTISMPPIMPKSLTVKLDEL